MKKLKIILCLALLGCNQHVGNNPEPLSKTQDSGRHNLTKSGGDSLNYVKENIPFLDSVWRKYDITINQIKNHRTLIVFTMQDIIQMFFLQEILFYICVMN